MRIPYRGHRALRRMDRSLRRSDPHLAAMLAIFARLTAGEAIASLEQAGPPGNWMRRGLAWLVRVVLTAAACLSACVRRVLYRTADACAAVRRAFSRGTGPTVIAPPAPHDPS